MIKPDPSWLFYGMSEEQIRGAVVAGWRLSMVVFVLWTVGGLSMIGLPGFVRAGDIAKLEENQRESQEQQRFILKTVLDLSLRELVKIRCKLNPRTSEFAFIEQQILEQKNRFAQVAKYHWQEPVQPCSETE